MRHRALGTAALVTASVLVVPPPANGQDVSEFSDEARAIDLLESSLETGAAFNLWWHRHPLLLPLLGDDPAYAEMVRPKG